jgi:hypothetical protein
VSSLLLMLFIGIVIGVSIQKVFDEPPSEPLVQESHISPEEQTRQVIEAFAKAIDRGDIQTPPVRHK